MPKGVYKHKQLSDAHKKSISNALLGNTWSRGKNLGNKNAHGKTTGERNGNWKGGISNQKATRERLAGREKPVMCEVCYSKR